MVMRRHERRGISLAPLTLALGVLTALWCFPAPVGMACILIAAVADSAAALIGTRWGRHRWPHDRVKSVEGSVAFFVSALVCASVYLPWTDSFFLALIATVFESLPLQDWDNFVTPVGAGLVAAVVMA
jgi:dolichol kinase